MSKKVLTWRFVFMWRELVYMMLHPSCPAKMSVLSKCHIICILSPPGNPNSVSAAPDLCQVCVCVCVGSREYNVVVVS